MEELVAELTHMARRSPEISQRSGVSVRVSVANAEVLDPPEVRTQLLSAGSPPQLVGFLIDIMGPAQSVENRTAETNHLLADERSDETGDAV